MVTEWLHAMNESFVSSQVRRICGLTSMQVNHWDRLGIVRPSLRSAEGSGSRRLYSLDDLAAAEVARRLREVGVPLEYLGAALSRLRALWPNLSDVPEETYVLIRPDGGCETIGPDAGPADLLSPHRVGILLHLGGVVEALRARMRSGAGDKPGAVRAEPAPVPRPRASAWGEDW